MGKLGWIATWALVAVFWALCWASGARAADPAIAHGLASAQEVKTGRVVAWIQDEDGNVLSEGWTVSVFRTEPPERPPNGATARVRCAHPMAQETLVVLVPPARRAALRAAFAAGPFEFRAVPHAEFSVKGDGAVVTLYTSGKLVVQASDPRLFLGRWTDLEAPANAGEAAARSSDADEPIDVGCPVSGSDEAGKGDYFGPLVVVAVRVEVAERLGALVEAGVTDSKALSDSKALRLGALLRDNIEFACERLDPVEYNAEWSAAGSLNPLLAELHGRVLARVARRGEAVVVDQFERHGLVARAVAPLGVRLTEVPRAERHAAVAAASVIARQEFLLGMRELAEHFEVELHKGAGAPVDEAGVRIVRDHGPELLERLAKLHFKNTQKILARV